MYFNKAEPRGVRQGDPISPLLFLLVTQNLSAILNHALHLNFLPGFDSSLTRNFNHLMFADDLILITKASRQAARNTLFCINMYSNITGQMPNLSKSAIYLPSWFNKRVSKSIASILGINIGSFPFTYLGAPISPHRITVRQLSPLVSKTATSIGAWNHAHISQAGRVVLLNSCIFSLPVYLLSIFYIPDSILESLSKLARNFLWGRHGKNHGFHSIGWRTVTLSKSEGGLGLRNLRNARIALLAKHVFSIINKDDKLWVSIFLHKYRSWTIWGNAMHSNVSAFHKDIIKTVNCIKPNLHLQICNPSLTNVWDDPWILDLPLSRKPTFINMDIIDNISINSFILNASFNISNCSELFGNNLTHVILNNTSFDNVASNEWVWRPISSKASTVAAIYEHLNSDGPSTDAWVGWRLIWKLRVTPRTKIFIWKLAHGKLPTGDYLYNINIGPATTCHFCGLSSETANHLIWHCRWAIMCWDTIFNWLGLSNSFFDHLSNGSWLTCNFKCVFNSDFVRALIASVALRIWTARCFFIFHQTPPNFNQIPSKAWADTYAFFSVHDLFGRNFSSPSHPPHFSLMVYTDASWDPFSGKSGFGFLILTNRNLILLAGAAGSVCSSPLEAELRAILLATEHCHLNGWTPCKLFSDCRCAIQMIIDTCNTTAWRFTDLIHAIKDITFLWPDFSWEHIDRDFNTFADCLAHFGRSNPALSLFAQGRDRPRWIEDLCSSLNFSF
ncbi:uncharacterized protein LOC120249385 [Dioscorea cayenensis subsp. rotundata]|uniref:Uncharacterized protein LOC120249385 n=1 Tax=Dioscorea cayennensis subsp. rotundata TaxID=55577 RepID=A0AB40AFY2_DIOCR|nr:uncharacterized protein LOC120249385 [Dioscorea cayenensis subsp. rotundata]